MEDGERERERVSDRAREKRERWERESAHRESEKLGFGVWLESLGCRV